MNIYITLPHLKVQATFWNIEQENCRRESVLIGSEMASCGYENEIQQGALPIACIPEYNLILVCKMQMNNY